MRDADTVQHSLLGSELLTSGDQTRTVAAESLAVL
jgi:hypothetical protein